MQAPVTAIRNLGPAMAADCTRAGIHSAGALREMGADAAHARLLAAGARPHFIAYYALVRGLQARPWNGRRGAEKEALRARFDALRAGRAESDPLERILDEIGTGRRRRAGRTARRRAV